MSRKDLETFLFKHRCPKSREITPRYSNIHLQYLTHAESRLARVLFYSATNCQSANNSFLNYSLDFSDVASGDYVWEHQSYIDGSLGQHIT